MVRVDNTTNTNDTIPHKNIEVTDKTERIEITLGEPGSRTQIYLWDADTNAPVNRIFEVRRTR